MSIVVALGAYAVTVNFTYDRATERADGSPLPLSEIAETRLYCDGALAATEQGADGDFSPNLGVGSHVCYATHVDTDGQESDPSNEVTKVVIPARPNPPMNLSL